MGSLFLPHQCLTASKEISFVSSMLSGTNSATEAGNCCFTDDRKTRDDFAGVQSGSAPPDLEFRDGGEVKAVHL